MHNLYVDLQQDKPDIMFDTFKGMATHSGSRGERASIECLTHLWNICKSQGTLVVMFSGPERRLTQLPLVKQAIDSGSITWYKQELCCLYKTRGASVGHGAHFVYSNFLGAPAVCTCSPSRVAFEREKGFNRCHFSETLKQALQPS